MNNSIPAVLTIAGSDSGGGAGIQADLRTFNAFNVYGCSAITAVTSQNPDEVRRVDVLSAKAVKTQLECVLDAFPVRFAKTGMLAQSDIIECVADSAKKYDLQLIVDPVMVSTSGTRLLEESAISAVKELLFPLAEWITPNIPEAELLCNQTLVGTGDFTHAALQLFEQYQCNVIIKCGHAITSGNVSDIVCYRGNIFALSSPVVNICGNTAHGTGCTLSSAIAANLALGKTWLESLMAAKAFVYGSLCEYRSLSSKLKQMYPPTENYLDLITVKEL